MYFVFSDDVGSYEERRRPKFCSAHPFFIRSGVTIQGEDWPSLRDGMRNLQECYELPAEQELKWSYIGSILHHRSRGDTIPADRPYSPFSDWSNDDLVSFVRKALGLLTNCHSCWIVYTVTDNNIGHIRATKDKVYKMHLQDLMQRAEMELQSCDGLAVMFLDSENERDDRCIREAYANIYRDGDFIQKYLHIIDTPAFVLSHQSFGIRLADYVADYVAGIFNNSLRGYQLSTDLFLEQVWPLLRKNSVGDPLGWGICEVPTDEMVRGQIREKLEAAGLLTPGSDKQAIG